MSHEGSDAGTSDPPGLESNDNSLAESVNALWLALRSALDQALELVALEARLAALSLAGIVALGVFVGASLVATWLLLAAAGAVWLVGHTGFGWVSALLMVVLLTLGLTVLAWLTIRFLSRNLEFRLTRRRLASAPGNEQNVSNCPTKS